MHSVSHSDETRGFKELLDLKEFKLLKSKLNISNSSEIEYTVQKNSNDENCELNKSQFNAAYNIEGPSLIIAGPGTGKTKTLSHRIAQLVKSGISQENILGLTFSNQAADELKTRVKLLLKNYLPFKLFITTFHSFGLSILNENLNFTGREKGFQIIRDREKKFILSEILQLNQKKCKDLIEAISNIKQHLVEYEKIENYNFKNKFDNNEIHNEYPVPVKNIFKSYNDILIKNNLFDYDDLLYLPYFILTQNIEILEHYKKKFQYINIDEYQDINFAQYNLIRLLASNTKSNICVIGDPDQAIYGFRGADVKFIKQFKLDYPEAKIFELEKSYRCSDNILSASRQILSEENKKIFYLKGIEEGVKISIEECNSEKSEAEFIARKIEELIGGIGFFSMDSGLSDGNKLDETGGLSDTAILCRTSRQFGIIENSLKEHSIPYQIIGEDVFYNEKPFSSIIDILKLTIQPDNNFLKLSVSQKIIKNIELVKYSEFLEKNKLVNFIKFVSEKNFNDEIDNQKDNFVRLLSLAKEFDEQPIEFLKFIDTSQSVDTYKKNIDSVVIMTMHSAKGLEFNSVFITGCSNKIIPFSLYKNYEVDIDEEKRLLYVAMTRAKKYLFLSYSKTIELFGAKIEAEQSPFITKIKKELIEFKKQKLRIKQPSIQERQLSLF